MNENNDLNKTQFSENDDMSMEDLMKEYGNHKEVKLGAKITAKIISKNEEGFRH